MELLVNPKILSIEITDQQYSELVAKLANEIEERGEYAPKELKEVFLLVTDKEKDFTNRDTVLSLKWKKRLREQRRNGFI